VAELPIELHPRKGVLKQMRDEQAAAATAAGPSEDATSAAAATADQSEDATPAVAAAADQSIPPAEQPEPVDKPSGTKSTQVLQKVSLKFFEKILKNRSCMVFH
jgi:hypothetical protein